MSNFNFLKNFNRELFEIGERLEIDVKTSPRAVPADATLFLERLVNDIYALTGHKKENDKISFYKKIDKLYRFGSISYIFKNKLQDAYSLRNEIHNDHKDIDEEFNIALNLDEKLYYIAKRYYTDFTNRYVSVPGYNPPKIANFKNRMKNEIHFDRCIICGSENKNEKSNICIECNTKIDNANYYMSIRNSFGEDKNFTIADLIDYGIPESYALSLVMELTKENLISKKGQYYTFNNKEIDDYFSEINRYVEISILVNKFFTNEITPDAVKKTDAYIKGSQNIKPFAEFYNLINSYLISVFENSIDNMEDVKNAVANASLDIGDVEKWFNTKKQDFINGVRNETFINFNELLLEEYLRNIKRGMDDNKAYLRLPIRNGIYEFWSNYYLGDNLQGRVLNVKKSLILKEIRKNKYLKDILTSANLTHDEFRRIYDDSRNLNDAFYRIFDLEYTQKRQNQILSHFRAHNDLTKAIKKAKISKKEFIRWYFVGENKRSEFYFKASELLMDKYLMMRKDGNSYESILKTLKIPKEIFYSWNHHNDLELFRRFQRESSRLSEELAKRDLIIIGLQNNHNIKDILSNLDISEDEFEKMYTISKKENNSFYRNYTREYCENRKRIFVKHLKTNDFFTSIVKSEITITDFNKWYLEDEKEFLSNDNPSEFYLTSTELLMDKYLNERRNHKTRSCAAKQAGLTNTMVNYWLKHDEIKLFKEFKNRHNRLMIELVTEGFKNEMTKYEIYNEYDIPVKLIESYIQKGSEDSTYGEIAHLYNEVIIPKQLERFLVEIKNNNLKKALKACDLSEKTLDYCYNRGKMEDDNFVEFTAQYLVIKIEKYVEAIISKKSHKFALKHSNLFKEEYEKHESAITKKIMDRRINIIHKGMAKNMSWNRIVSMINMDLDEVYECYDKGRKGDEVYEYFAFVFGTVRLTMMIVYFKELLDSGVPKNRLLKSVKKRVGRKEYRLIMKYELLEEEHIDYIINNNFRKFLDFNMRMLKKDGTDKERHLNILKTHSPYLFDMKMDFPLVNI